MGADLQELHIASRKRRRLIIIIIAAVAVLLAPAITLGFMMHRANAAVKKRVDEAVAYRRKLTTRHYPIDEDRQLLHCVFAERSVHTVAASGDAERTRAVVFMIRGTPGLDPDARTLLAVAAGPESAAKYAALAELITGRGRTDLWPELAGGINSAGSAARTEARNCISTAVSRGDVDPTVLSALLRPLADQDDAETCEYLQKVLRDLDEISRFGKRLGGRPLSSAIYYDQTSLTAIEILRADPELDPKCELLSSLVGKTETEAACRAYAALVERGKENRFEELVLGLAWNFSDPHIESVIREEVTKLVASGHGTVARARAELERWSRHHAPLVQGRARRNLEWMAATFGDD